MPKSGDSPSRRRFLITMGGGGVAAAAAVVSAVSPESTAEAKLSNPQPKRGYQLSEHIKKYYRTTRA